MVVRAVSSDSAGVEVLFQQRLLESHRQSLVVVARPDRLLHLLEGLQEEQDPKPDHRLPLAAWAVQEERD